MSYLFETQRFFTYSFRLFLHETMKRFDKFVKTEIHYDFLLFFDDKLDFRRSFVRCNNFNLYIKKMSNL